jgi:formiminoglutamase
METSIYFTLSALANELKQNAKPNSFADSIEVGSNLEDVDLSHYHIAIFGVKEERASQNEGCANGMDNIRQHFYQLFPGAYAPSIIDLGDILSGETIQDTYFAVSKVVEECLKNKVIPIIIGGSQDLTHANYMAYQRMEQTVNVLSIDNRFKLGDVEEPLNDENFLSHIIMGQPNMLFNYCNLGYQSYLIDDAQELLMQELYFDTIRLGQLQKDITLAEPAMRYADIVSVDLSAIRFSEFPAHYQPMPNGFYGDEICQLMRYAGISDKVSSLGIYQYNPDFDNRTISASLVAQMLWCFVDGYYNRKQDIPVADKTEYQKFVVPLKNGEYTLVFYKSLKTDRWWIEVPYASAKSKYQRHQVIPCSYEHYKTASADEMPDIWWKTYQKLS